MENKEPCSTFTDPDTGQEIEVIPKDGETCEQARKRVEMAHRFKKTP